MENGQDSVDELLALLPNLKSAGVRSCRFIESSQKVGRGVPAPSDTKLEIVGWFMLDKKSILDKDYSWKPSERSLLPQPLSSILPDGEVYRETEYFDFNQNPIFAYGMVVRAPAKEDHFFFMARDLDHPIVLSE